MMNRRKIRDVKPSVSSATTLNAVALQDHLMRNWNISDPIRPRNIPSKQKNWRKEARPVVDTGRNLGRQTRKNDSVDEKEYVLDQKTQPLSLAQKLGLVECPEQYLSENDWQKAKAQSNERHDSKHPCVICKEDFGTQQQVLLSCSHVFHRTCLEAFERFSGKKSCPMCRKEQYQKRVIHEGAHEYRHKCATVIQSTWRGYVVRSWYKKLRETVPPKDPNLRQKFYEDKLHSITERMVNSMDYDVNAFLNEIDRSVEASRDVFRHFDDLRRMVTDEEWEVVQLKAVERGHTDCPICLTPLKGQGLTKAPPTQKTQAKDAPKLESKGRDRKTKSASRDYQVKLLPKIPPPRKGQAEKTGDSCKQDSDKDTSHGSKASRCKVLLSCSHVFHQTCLEAFEEFAVGDRKFVCPVCRTRYQKKVL